ncbi:MAG TPA: hypothetical protein VHO69_14165 [Phototrophicaceae bacterium]|nr:hypothetical protein [Phototrophicaceae bacterium]
MKLFRWFYPSLVGLLLGLLQTGLFFQLTFTLSSSFRTFLMVTVCWLSGSVIGIRLARLARLPLNGFVLLALLSYFGCVILLGLAPFNTQLWPVYAALIGLTGLYPGVFFVRLGDYYAARALFFKENNGFIVGLVSGTLFFLVAGRAALWILPILAAAVVIICTPLVFRSSPASKLADVLSAAS